MGWFGETTPRGACEPREAESQGVVLDTPPTARFTASQEPPAAPRGSVGVCQVTVPTGSGSGRDGSASKGLARGGSGPVGVLNLSSSSLSSSGLSLSRAPLRNGVDTVAWQPRGASAVLRTSWATLGPLRNYLTSHHSAGRCEVRAFLTIPARPQRLKGYCNPPRDLSGLPRRPLVPGRGPGLDC